MNVLRTVVIAVLAGAILVFDPHAHFGGAHDGAVLALGVMIGIFIWSCVALWMWLDKSEVVPRSGAETLAEALEQIEGSPRAGIGCPHQVIARDALAAYRSRHPKETP